MNGYDAVDRRVWWRDRGSAPSLPRWIRETFVILGVSGTVLLFSGPVRGELADQIARGALVGAEAWARGRLVPAWISPNVYELVILVLATVALAVIVLLLAAALQTVSQLQRYAFNGVIERRYAVIPTHFQVFSTALPLTLGLALTIKGPAALCAWAVFTLLLTAIRLTVGRDYEVLVSPPNHLEQKPRQPKPQEAADVSDKAQESSVLGSS